MIIETNRSLTEAEAKEITTVIMNARQLIKNPTKKISSIFRFCRRGAIFCALGLLFFSYFLIRGDRDALTLTGTLITIVAVIFLAVFYSGVRKTYRTFLSRGDEHVIMNLDEKGIDYEVVGNRRYQSSWENVAFIRVFQEMIYMMPKDITGMIFSVEKKYLEELKSFLKENQILVQVIE
ncbi:MAG: hypothetical protein IKO03_06475 [Lachnospiraceae bacterium]|nr:hypothetical protein [Lachnospiraceae bacterium]MBR4606944.1 hypothetical protein [Lachnospiraceae bacterium]